MSEKASEPIVVVLEQQGGEEKRRGRMMPTTRPQFRVILEQGEHRDHVGYVFDRPGSPFNAIVPASELDEQELAAITAKLTDHFGIPPGFVSTIPEEEDTDGQVETNHTAGDSILVDGDDDPDHVEELS
jgi:hypothetical protein